MCNDYVEFSGCRRSLVVPLVVDYGAMFNHSSFNFVKGREAVSNDVIEVLYVEQYTL